MAGYPRIVESSSGTEDSGVFAEHKVNAKADIVSTAAGIRFFLCGNIQSVERRRCVVPAINISVASIAGEVGIVSGIYVARPASSFANGFLQFSQRDFSAALRSARTVAYDGTATFATRSNCVS